MPYVQYIYISEAQSIIPALPPFSHPFLVSGTRNVRVFLGSLYIDVFCFVFIYFLSCELLPLSALCCFNCSISGLCVTPDPFTFSTIRVSRPQVDILSDPHRRRAAF